MMQNTPSSPTWMRYWLIAAGLYNGLWGASVILFPHFWFDVCGIARPNYPQLWQCVGMIVGCYAVGYLLAAINPYRYWPVVVVGLLGKILGPIGFASAVIQGVFPPLFGLNILTNDVIWWVPFSLMLWHTWQHYKLWDTLESA
jgi:small multidrug resistance pump